MKQLGLRIKSTWGGWRKGAGRKPRRRTAGVSHHTRPFHDRNHPVHVTLRVLDDLPPLRQWDVAAAIGKAVGASEKPRFRVVHFSIQPDHMHMIVEAGDRMALARGMQGLLIRTARKINRVLGRKGSVFADRYHAHYLTTATEVRNAYRYVLLNYRKHTNWGPGLDPYSSAAWFDGWKDGPPPLEREGPVARARTRLGTKGWKKLGLIRLDDALTATPRPPPARAARSRR